MSIDTIYKSSMRKLSKAKSVGEMQCVVSEFDRACDEHEKRLNDYYAKEEARMKEELDRQEKEFEAQMTAQRAENEVLYKEIEDVLKRSESLLEKWRNRVA